MSGPVTIHVDRCGTPLSQGDRVVYLKRSRESSHLELATVVGATECYLKIRHDHQYRTGEYEVSRVSPEKTVRVAEHLQGRI
ncbi:hypothetical protein LABOLPEG_00027 [Pseudomonas phage phi 21A]|nr:hypothetical protein LABOLPEG_00027 [Pseudomonas phage phi 21A]